jgi:hypothetical protein
MVHVSRNVGRLASTLHLLCGHRRTMATTRVFRNRCKEMRASLVLARVRCQGDVFDWQAEFTACAVVSEDASFLRSDLKIRKRGIQSQWPRSTTTEGRIQSIGSLEMAVMILSHKSRSPISVNGVVGRMKGVTTTETVDLCDLRCSCVY